MIEKRFKSMEEAVAYAAKHGGAHLMIQHDPWCVGGRNMRCNCSPDYVVRDLTAANTAEGEAEQRRWLDRHRSN